MIQNICWVKKYKMYFLGWIYFSKFRLGILHVTLKEGVSVPVFVLLPCRQVSIIHSNFQCFLRKLIAKLIIKEKIWLMAKMLIINLNVLQLLIYWIVKKGKNMFRELLECEMQYHRIVAYIGCGRCLHGSL